MPEYRRLLAFVVSIGVAGGLLYWALPRMLSAAGGSETEITTALKSTEKDGLSLEVRSSPDRLISVRHSFDRITVSADARTRRATVASTLDFNGTLGKTAVSSLGLERIAFEYAGGSWHPVAGYAPQLADVVSTLEARRKALAAGDRAQLISLSGRTDSSGLEPAVQEFLAAADRSYQAKAWFIRLERDEVLVTEQYEESGVLPDRLLHRAGARKLRLQRRAGKLLFPEGLM